MIYNTSYQRIATIRAGNGYRADLHEIRLTPQGTAWIDVFDPIHMNLSARGRLRQRHRHRLGRAGGRHQDRSGDVGVACARAHLARRIEQPRARKQLPVGLRPHQLGRPGSSPGDVLLSARNTWTLYDVDLHTGAHHWRLGGKRSQLQARRGHALLLAARRRIAARWADLGVRQRLGPAEGEAVAGPAARAELATHTVSLVKQFVNPTKTLLAESQGNALNLPGGNWLMGYGGLPNFTEFDASGHVLLDGDARQERAELQDATCRRGAAQPTSPSARSRPRRPRAAACRRGELERGHRRRLLAGAGGRLAERPHTRGDCREGRLSDHDHGARRRALRGGAGARRHGRGHRHLADGQGLSAPLRWPSRCSPCALLAGLGSAALLGLPRCVGRWRRERRLASCSRLRAARAERLRGARRRRSRVTVSPGARHAGRLCSHQISLLGVPAGDAHGRRASVGSRSGAHAGRLLAYSQGDGASFVPERPFAAGGARDRARRAASRRTARRPFAWSFTVAVRDSGGEALAGSPRPRSPPALLPGIPDFTRARISSRRP